ncbi:hypothetical protein IAT38_001939 [Cryptococcus sp. DSM 104549]
MCCEADWKREVVPDHKFDFINVREFHKGDIWTRIKYIFRYIFLLKSFAVYGLDIFTAVTMLSSSHWTNAITSKCDDSDSSCAVEVQFKIAKWVFVGCIIFSFLLLGYETWKAKKVIDSRDISYAFTNLLANDYYSFRSYDNFCLFCQIESSTKKKDDFAFFVFFTFKGWKRLLLADGPRQSINGILLYSFAYANNFQTSDIPAYWDNSAITAMLLFSMILTVLIFAGSLIMLIAAAVFYVPLLCYIQGNLKEYVCHKVDKRISELIKKKQRQRIARNAAAEKAYARSGGKGGASSLKDGKDGMGMMPQPTLPQVSLDDTDDAMYRAKMKAERAGMDVPVTRVGGDGYDDVYGGGAGQMPAGYEYPPPGADYGVYQQGYSEDYSSSANLTANAAPLGIFYPPTAAPPPPQSGFQNSYTSSVLPNPYSPAPGAPGFPPSRSQQSLHRYAAGQPPQQVGGRASPTPSYGYGDMRRDSGGSGGMVYERSASPYGYEQQGQRGWR